MATISVDIWSDIVCPWCYIGKRNFDNALASFEHRERVQVRWHSLELDPLGSPEPRLTLPERHRRDVGGTVEQARQRIGQVVALAAEAGLDYDLDKAMPVNSFDSHRVMKLADRAGVGDAVRERLMAAYTSEGAILSDAETLVRLAAEAGLDPARTRAMLAGEDFASEVREDGEAARRIGVSGVPTFVFDGKVAVSGGQRPEAFTRLLERSWNEQPPDDQGVCTIGGSC